MTEHIVDYTFEEQMAAHIARSFGPDDDIVASAVTNTGLVGLSLAQKLYAPRLAFQMGAKGRNSLLSKVRFPFIIGKPPEEFVESLTTIKDTFEFGFKGKWCMLMQPVQIDKFGNANLSQIGDKENPSRVFVGARGLPDNTTGGKKTFYVVPDHTKRVFVEKVDFISGVGFGPEREDGTLQWGAPTLVFSNLGIFDFDEKTKCMRLKAVFKGVTVQQVIENTAFELVMPDSVPEADSPTKEELRLIREEIDPVGIRRLDYARGDEAKQVFAEVAKGTTYDRLYKS